MVLYTSALYTFLPFGPRFWKAVSYQFGNSSNYLGLFFTCFLGACFLVYLVFQKQERRASVYVSFFLISLICLLELKYLCVTGAERFHVLMYGILACVVFWAFKLSIKNKTIYIYTTILSCFLGVVDEAIQDFLPMRFFDMKDILMNCLSCGMGTLFILFVLRPELNHQKEG